MDTGRKSHNDPDYIPAKKTLTMCGIIFAQASQTVGKQDLNIRGVNNNVIICHYFNSVIYLIFYIIAIVSADIFQIPPLLIQIVSCFII